MKQYFLCLAATLLISPSYSLEFAPFTQPATVAAVTAFPEFARDFLFFKRDDSCPTNYNGCSNEGNSGVCCQSGTTCTVDGANNIACCPTGAKCTGTLGVAATGSNTNTHSTSTTTSGFIFPQETTTTTTTTSPTATITGSTISGAAFPFVYIPTSFSNAATCSSYYSYCQDEYKSCVASLEGAYGVTVAGGDGAGVTVQGNTMSASAAVSTCSSLSREACYGLQESYCTAFGGATTTTTAGQFITGSNAPTRRSSLHDILLAVAAGFVGMVL